MTEEPSMREALRGMMANRYPGFVEGSDWFVLSHNGKSDLEKNIDKRIRAWNFGSPHFLILRDADSGDCVEIKNKLMDRVKDAGKPATVRVVCQELESWFLGDLEAVSAAYPTCRVSARHRKFRNPDRLSNASQELAKLTEDRSKIGRARRIAKHMVPARNGSPSFQVFLRSLEELV